MNDSGCLGALLSVCIYMAHNIMTYQLLTLFCHIIIDVLCVCLQFLDLLICDDGFPVLGQSQLFLRLCQCNPQLSPCTEFHIRGENILHLLACIALGKRAYISVVHG